MRVNIHQWAIKHGIPFSALKELSEIIEPPLTPPPGNVTTEADMQNLVQLEASKLKITLWRNNVGSLLDSRGVPVRYGLANTTKQMNDVFKSSDLIGIRPIVITPDLVGKTIGQFVAREVKQPSWHYSATKHEKAQSAFLKFVSTRGGDACFVNGLGSFV